MAGILNFAEKQSNFLSCFETKVAVATKLVTVVKVWHKVCFNREECVKSDQLRYHVIVLFYFND